MSITKKLLNAGSEAAKTILLSSFERTLTFSSWLGIRSINPILVFTQTFSVRNCPFCKSRPIVYKLDRGQPDLMRAQVRCPNIECQLAGPIRSDAAQAVATWNALIGRIPNQEEKAEKTGRKALPIS